jgi:hypothetical protein
MLPKEVVSTATNEDLLKLVGARIDQKAFNLIVRQTTGDLASATDGTVVLNYADKTIKMYADGTWVSLGTWYGTGSGGFPMAFPLAFPF